MAKVEAGSESPQAKGSSLDNYYENTYGDQAATVASVVALASHAELFDRDTSDEETVESYFLRVPNSTLVVNRIDTNAEYGLSKSFMVLDEDNPVFQLDGGRLVFDNLTPGQAAALERGLLEVASPLLVHENFFQLDVAQGLSNEGEAQARTILSQGDAITPAIVTKLNDLMAAEEDLRCQDQATRGLVGEVRYPRFTEYELNQNLSMDMIARQLIAQSPVVEVQAEAIETPATELSEPLAEQAVAQPVVAQAVPSVSDYLESMKPETIGAMVYSQYYRWADKNWERDEPEDSFVANGYRVDHLGDRIGGHDPMPFQVVEVATDRVVMNFTLAEGRWAEREPTHEEIVNGEQPRADYTGDTVVVNLLDDSLKTQFVLAFEDPHKKASLIASTYLNAAGVDQLSLPNGLIFQRESHEDGSLRRDLVFTREFVSSEGRAYAIAQAFPSGGGMGLGIPVSVERVIEQEFAQFVEQYEQTQALSLDQQRSQAEVQEPPVAGYESESTNPHLQGKATVMLAVEAPVQAQTEIDLRDLMSVKTLSIMETGKVPQQRVEVDGRSQLADRTPEEGLAMVARAAYGAENFCKENNLPIAFEAEELIENAAREIIHRHSLVSLDHLPVERGKCRPVMEVATHSQSGVWARIEEKYPEHAGKVPEAIKAERAALPVVAEAKTAVAEASMRQVPVPVLKLKEVQAQLPTQFEMAVTVAAYNLQKAGVDRMGHDNDKAKVIFNKSKDGNISVINKADDTLIASRNAVTGQVVPGVLPEGQDYTKAFAVVVQMQTEKYVAKTAVATPKAKAKAGDGR